MATEYSKGLLFHTTSRPNALLILSSGYLTPFYRILSVSFTSDPFFGSSVDPFGVTFVFPEQVIREKYGGVEKSFGYLHDPERERKLWEQEEEIEVEGRRVYVEDAVEVLTTRASIRKYGYGWKYPYVDLRSRRGPPWKAFRAFAPPMPQPPWQGPPGIHI